MVVFLLILKLNAPVPDFMISMPDMQHCVANMKILNEAILDRKKSKAACFDMAAQDTLLAP